MTEERVIETFKIIGLPKGAVMWPTFAGAILLGLLGLLLPDSLNIFTSIFLTIFAVNLLILFFDFARGAVFGIFGLFVAAIAVIYSMKINVPIARWIHQGKITTSGEFLISLGIIYLILFLIALGFRSSFEYFEVSSNEIVRKHGVLGNAERHNAPNLEIRKEIDDVFESLLLFGAGNLRIITSKGREFHIDNVPRINRAEKEIRKLLGRLEVDTG